MIDLGIEGQEADAVGPVRKADEEDAPWLERLLTLVNQVLDPDAENHKRRNALEHLSIALQPQYIRAEARHLFVHRAMQRGVIEAAVHLIELGSVGLASAACSFLGDFAFDSDDAARAVLKAFDRIAERFKAIFEELNHGLAWEHMPLLEAAILLCVNIAATCPSGHDRLIPLVQPVCLQIINNPRASHTLRGNTILLLANLSMTVRQELRALRVADVLLELVLESRVSGIQKSVAESVIIFLHGDQKCEEIDKLMDVNVVGEYCVPIMELTLRGEEFRGMYPHLMYSAQLLQVLAQSREYAEVLVAHERVVPLLLQANQCQDGPVRVESDLEGRRLALEALWSLNRFGLWPGSAPDEKSQAFLDDDLPRLLSSEHAGIRAAASGLCARLDVRATLELLMLGRQLEIDLQLPMGFCRQKVLSFILPFLESK